jgi:hypothetical protein
MEAVVVKDVFLKFIIGIILTLLNMLWFCFTIVSTLSSFLQSREFIANECQVAERVQVDNGTTEALEVFHS